MTKIEQRLTELGAENTALRAQNSALQHDIHELRLSLHAAMFNEVPPQLYDIAKNEDELRMEER